MTTESRSSRLRFGCLAILALLLSACSSAVDGPGGRIGKVKYYHLMPNYVPQTIDPTVVFERQHFLHGAVTKQEIIDRFGHYYTIFWKADDRSGPVTVKFEYQQERSGLSKRVQEQIVDAIGRSNVSKFQVTGPEYQKSGRVIAWRVSVLRGKEELVSQQSALWN
ncbi:MAG: hypothetical protein IAE77_12660 [Prosthecobacter sp.]|jgi:hypothetical protein|uniref:hypothetical protein n=1 Tax=Prosthecobacter sp. TaxID=1965333 RepID=UPI001A0097ED|nr:hypothetical protein [Prosthecobacter sp.]MBE2284300.1 hypothetical protein [Prosthecobacter sp.]